jgi:hypothetical protein
MQKNYTVHWQDGQVRSVEVDGVDYHTPEEIPDPGDRTRIEALIEAGPEPDFDPGDFDLPADTSFPVTRVVFTVFLGVAILLLAITAFLTAGTIRKSSREASAPGRVTALTSRADSTGQEFFYPVVAFTLADGTRKEVQLPEGSWPPAYEPNQPVTVRYDPENPLDARIQSVGDAADLWIAPTITGFLGLALLMAAWMVRRIFGMEPRRAGTE